jgi:hypothetical protein
MEQIPSSGSDQPQPELILSSLACARPDLNRVDFLGLQYRMRHALDFKDREDCAARVIYQIFSRYQRYRSLNSAEKDLIVEIGETFDSLSSLVQALKVYVHHASSNPPA